MSSSVQAGTPPDTGARPPAALVAVPVRYYGRWAGAAMVLAALLYLLWRLTHLPQIDYQTIPRFLFKPPILRGLQETIVLSLVAQSIGILLGIALAVMRLSRNPVLSAVSWLYIWFFRGTPLIVQILFWFNGLLFLVRTVTIAIPFTGVQLYSAPARDVITGFTAAILALSLNEGAYMAEIVRAGILAVDRGQTEAAAALGMTGGLTMRRIVLPQAMRVILPPTGNEFISMLKNTALVVVIGGGELLSVSTHIYSQSGKIFELLVVASIWYLVLTSLASIGQYYLERRFSRGDARELVPTPLQRLRARVARPASPGRSA